MMNSLPQWSRTALCYLLLLGGLPLLAQPANDLCGDAEALATDGVAVDGTTIDATADGLPPGCFSLSEGVWYTFVGDGQRVTITVTPDDSWDPEVNLSTGTCDDLTNVSCRDGGNTGDPEMVLIDSEPGVTYYVYVADWSSSTTNTNAGDFTISALGAPAPTVPTNDECADATALTVNPDFNCGETTAGTTELATMSAQGNGTCGGTPNDDVWFSFVATSTAHRISLLNGTPAPGTTSTDLYHVLWGGTCDAPDQITCSDGNTSTTDGLTIGDTYLVQVYSFGTTAAIGFDICIGTPPPPPANDNCVDAIALDVQFEGFTELDSFTNVSSTPSGIGPIPCGGSTGSGADVFFTVTPTSDTLIIEVTDGGDGSNDFAMTAYSGTCDAPTLIECDDDDGPGAFPRLELGGLTPGESILLRVYEFGQNADGAFAIAAFEPAPAAIVLDCPTTDSVFVGADCMVELGDLTADITADDTDATFEQDSLAASMVGLVNDSISTFDVTITATSPNNPADATCVISVSVVDTVAPILTCQDITVALSTMGTSSLDSTMLADSIVVSAMDNCSMDATVEAFEAPSISCASQGMASATFVATDALGNTDSCTVTITVTDDLDFCSGNIAVDCGEATDTVFVADDCMVALGDLSVGVLTNADSISQEPAVGTMLGVGDTTVLVIYNLNGAADTCEVALTVADTTAPVAVCMDVEVFLDEDGNLSLSGAATADPEPLTSVSGTLDTDDPTFNRAFGSADACTISGAGTNVFYETQDFTISAADMYTFSMEESGDYDGFFALYVGGFDPADACMNFLQSADDEGPNGNEPDLVIQLDLVPGDYTLVTTTFGNGQTGDYTYNISSDNGGQVFAASSAVEPGTVSVLDGGSTDNCSMDSLMFATDVDAFTCAEVGDTTVTLTVTDAAGNSSTCTSVVTISDTLAPVITLGDLVVNLDLTGGDSIDVTEVASVVDNCDAAPTVTADRDLTFGCADIGEQTVVVTATDASGNTSTDTLDFFVTFEQPDFACIARLNVTLNDNCEFLVEPSQVLRGNTACLDVFGFEITVMDGDTSNGPIIDGCGTYDYMIRSTASPTVTVAGFVGDYAEENWTIEDGDNDGVVFTESTITLSSPGSSTDLANDDPSVSYQFMEMATVNMTIDYELESEIIPDVLVVDFNGDVVFESVDAGTDDPDTGSEDFELEVQPGNTLVISIQGDGFLTGGVQSVVTVRDFEVTTANLLGLDFETCWGTINAEDKTPIALEETPDNILSGLFCADVDANDVNTLPSTVSKCFLVDNEGTLIPGTMDDALMAILTPVPFDAPTAAEPLIPTFSDGCASTIEVCVSDVVARPADGCGQTIITRTFRANEADGCPALDPEEESADEEVVASYTVSFDRPSLDSLNASNIQPVVEIEACGTTTSPLEFLPQEEDFPFLQLGERSFSLASDEAACSMIATTFENSESIIQTCANTVKFQRTYTVVDWCNPTEVQTFSQFVKIGDTTGPNFTEPSATIDSDGNLDPVLTYRTNVGGECAALVRLDGPGVGATDECAGEITMTVSIYPEGDLTQPAFGAYQVIMDNGAPELSDPLEVGDYAFVYVSTDVCGNQTRTTVPFQVVDGNGPTAFCEDGLNVSLSRPGGIAVVTPEMIDKGSVDDCSDVLTYALAVGPDMTTVPTEFDDQITFTCDDLGIQFVTLEVTDSDDNANYCWTEVLVELKAGDIPTCIAPSAVTLTCSEATAALPSNLEEATEAELNAAFGVATGIGTCETTVTGTFVVNNLNECGIGTAVREYSAMDAQGGISTNPCTQLITIVGVFDYQITLPGNASTNDCMDEFEADELSITGGACDLPVVTPVTEEIFNTPGDECYQIRTTYTIINTCEFDPATGGTTVITRDGLDADDESPIYLNVVSRNQNTESDDLAFVSGSDNAQFTPNDDDDLELVNYAASAGRGNFTYVQNINVFDRTSPIVQVAAPTACLPGCTADVSLPFSATDECLAPRIMLELDPNFTGTFEPATVDGVVITLDATDADNGNYVINATGVPAGDHAIRITAIDGCGNSTPEIVQLSVCGDVAPVPLCIQTLVATLQMNDDTTMAMAEVWATDFLTNSPLLDCFGDEVTKFGIVRSGEGPATVDQIGAKVFCTDVPDFVSFEVYAFSDNLDDNVAPAFCSVLVQVVEGDGVTCGTGGNLAGTVSTASSSLMPNVEVTLTGADDMDEMQMTDANGAFNFANLPVGGDYTLTPAYQEPVNLQEVKISDVVMISSVILGAADFDSPYDYLAADVNQDGRLNVLDMVGIQRVILGLDDIYRTGESWGFVPAGVDVSNPYAVAFPEVINVNDLEANVLDADFVAFAYGNVIGEGRTAMTIETADATLAAGELHTLTLDATELAGFQGTLELAAGLELVSADYTGEGALNLNYAAQGQIAIALRSGSVSLEVRATEAGKLSNLVTLTDAITVREGVTANGASGAINLTFGASVAGEAVTALGEATPNPVVESTMINYTLATDGDVTLSIQDVQGRTILVRNLRGTAGANGERINAADLKGATGVLTYTLVAGDFSATKKMVVVR